MCEYCPQTLLINQYKEKIGKKEFHLTMDTFKKCLSTVPTTEDMHFTGYSEPLDNPEAIDLILHAYNKGHKVLLNTTLVGPSATMENIDKIKHIPFKMFNVHAPSKTFKEKIGVKTPPDYLPTGQRVLDQKWIELLEYTFSVIKGINMHCHGGLHPTVAQMLPPEMAYAFTHGITRGVNTRAQSFELVKTKVPPEQNIRGKCNRVRQPVLIPDGSLALCCQDYGLNHINGNLLEQTWDEFQNSTKYQEILKNGANLCDYCVRGGPSEDAEEFHEAISDIRKPEEPEVKVAWWDR